MRVQFSFPYCFPCSLLRLVRRHCCGWSAKGFQTILALLVVIGFVSAVGLLLVILVGASLAEFQNQLPIYEQRLESLFINVNNFAIGLGFTFQFSDISSAINPESIASGVGKLVNEVGGLVANAFLIFLTVIFILFEISTLPKKLEKIFSRPTDSIERLSGIQAKPAALSRHQVNYEPCNRLAGVADADLFGN